MVYVFVLLAVALVIGPVMWIRPSRGQQRLARIRMKARELGIDVRIIEIPQTRRAAVRREEVALGALYRLGVHDPRAVLPLSHRCLRDAQGGWESEGDQLPQRLQDTLELVQSQLPVDAVGIELGPLGPGIYWREMGEDKAVEHIAAQLRLLLDAMRV